MAMIITIFNSSHYNILTTRYLLPACEQIKTLIINALVTSRWQEQEQRWHRERAAISEYLRRAQRSIPSVGSQSSSSWFYLAKQSSSTATLREWVERLLSSFLWHSSYCNILTQHLIFACELIETLRINDAPVMRRCREEGRKSHRKGSVCQPARTYLSRQTTGSAHY